MKKLLFIMLFGLIGMFAQSQTARNYVAFTSLSTTDTQATYLVVVTPAPIAADYPVTLPCNPVNTSGTATVTATPEGSLDGTNFYTLETATTVNTAGTVALKAFVYPNAYFRYYRIKLISSGTGVTAFTGSLGLK